MSYINKNSFKKIVLVAVIVLAAAFGTQKAHAATTALSGWAWSSNIGWISFNSADAGAGGGPYAVTVSTSSDSTIGTLGGYAWSSNIGWIKFGGLDTASMPSGSTFTGNAQVDFSTGNISGWVRACAGTADGRCGSMTSRTDGWDGWVSLSGSNYTSPNTSGYQGTSTQGVTLGIDKTKPEAYGRLTGFAWGGDVVGWISFKPAAVIGVFVPTICSTPPCDVVTTSPAFNVSGASAVIPRQVGALARPGILVSGGTSGAQDITVTIENAFSKPGVTITLLNGSNVSASSVLCAITPSNPSCSLAKVRVAVTDAVTAPEEINIPIVGTPSTGAPISGIVHVVIPRVSSSDLSLWAVPALSNGNYDTVTKLSSITIREGSTANLAWETAGVDTGSCAGKSIGVNDSPVLNSWKTTQPDSKDSDTPFTINNLTKGQYTLQLSCTSSGSVMITNSISIKVIKSDETEF